MSGRKAVGLDLGGTFIKIGLVDQRGRVIKKDEIPTLADQGKRSVVLKQMEKAVDFALAGSARKEIAGIGIGTPGLVDNDGMVYEAPNIPGWDNLPLKRLFAQKYKLPTVVENDVNSITWGEYLFGAGRGSRTMICVTLGTGLGGGVVINGKLLRGGTYSAVELGHITIAYDGLKCNCGSIGCVERYVQRDAIVERAIDAIKKDRKTLIIELADGDLKNITPKLISEACRKGDALAKEIWTDVGVCLGAMFTSVVNIFNPEIIVIGGGISKAGRILFDTALKTIKARAMHKLSKDLKIVPAGLGEDTGIISAGALVFQK